MWLLPAAIGANMNRNDSSRRESDSIRCESIWAGLDVRAALSPNGTALSPEEAAART